MTGKRKQAARKSAQKEKGAPREATHLADKRGNLHDNVTVFEPSHGRNMADRMDTMDEHATEVLPATDPTSERAGIPLARRVDEGQNRGGE